MKLLKIIVVLFIAYFIRRFIQMYRTIKLLQNKENAQKNESQKPKSDDSIEADYKIID